MRLLDQIKDRKSMSVTEATIVASTLDKKSKAYEIMVKHFNYLMYHSMKREVGATDNDSLVSCPVCDGIMIVKMAGGSKCTECDHQEIPY